MIGIMALDHNALMHNGTWLSVFGVLAVFIVFYVVRSAIQFIYSVWPFGKIKALRRAPKTVDKWQIASPNSHLHARAQVVRRLNEATDALAKQIIQTKLSGVAATTANFAQGIIGVIMLMSYIRSKVSPDTRHYRPVSHGLGHSHGANPSGSGGQLCHLLAFTQRRRKPVS
jgi:hypothetical protein